MQFITHSHPLVFDKVALLLLGILAGHGGHGGKGIHPDILNLEAFQVFEDPRNGVWVQSRMTPIHWTNVQSLPSFQEYDPRLVNRHGAGKRLVLCAIAFG